MNKALQNSLTTAERRFLAGTSREALAALDEDEVIDLHARARRMRDKYVSTYRRSAVAAVEARGGRGASYAENQRDRGKAEIFETALARVSRRLGALAAESAAALRRERITAARGDVRPEVASAVDDALEPAGAAPRAARRTPRTVKRMATERSAGARRQAKRDAGPKKA